MIYKKNEQELQDLGALFTVSEIKQQPATWLKTFDIIAQQKAEIKQLFNELLSHDDYMIVMSGAGTSEFVGNSLLDHFRKQFKNRLLSIPTTNIVSNPELYFEKDKPTLLISFARSGNSPESLATVNQAKVLCDHLYHLVITCNVEGKLITESTLGDNQLNVVLPPETNDKSLAMTSSYTNMVLAAYLVFSIDQLDALKPVIEDLAKKAETTFETNTVEELLNNKKYSRYVFLGSNELKGFAQESGLKSLELTSGQRPTLFDTTLGFRHGPKSFLNEETLTVVYLSKNPYTLKYDLDLINSLPHDVLVIAQEDVSEKLTKQVTLMNYNSDFQNILFGLICIISGQTLGVLSSLQEGLQPDNPSPSGLISRVVTGVTIYELEDK